MNKLQYKTFTWPNNPEVYLMDIRREPCYDPETKAFTGLGPVCRTITGSGTFFGAGAYESFRKLSALLEQTTAGTLTHPVFGAVTVFFTRLELTQTPKADCAAYAFTFQTESDLA